METANRALRSRGDAVNLLSALWRALVPRNMKHKGLRLAACVAAAALLTCVHAVSEALAQQERYLDVRRGEFSPIPIAITAFAGDSAQSNLVTGIITNNLKRSVFLSPLDPKTFPEPAASPDQVPHFDVWRAINAQFVVTGRVSHAADGRLQTEFRLWDTTSGSQAAGSQYVTDPNNARRVAHIISDAIFSRITGEKGFFDTRVAFVDETGPREHRRKRLAIMDQDGANVRYLTRGDDLAVTPRFSPSSQDVTYMSFGAADPKVLLLNVETGQREVVGNFPGMTFSPRFSPDGKKMVFESDRGGSQQLYVMSANGGNPRRISFGEGRYATPVWSPKGDYIAFTKQKGGSFAIGVMRPDGSGERILTEGFHNEGPTWAPNGLFLMFFRDPGGQGGPKLYMTDIFGRAEFPVPTQNYASDPSWSPLLN